MNTNELLKIIITDKDLKKYKKVMKNKDGQKYTSYFSNSGMVIDELAYASKQWTSDDLWENNIDYSPYIPYEYDYEYDLFEATKTASKLYSLAKTLGLSLNANWERLAKEQKLQAGATVALNNPDQWNELLEAYKEKLQEDRTDGISKAYNAQLQEEIDSFYSQLNEEWLYGDRDSRGVIKEIQKYWEAEDVVYNSKDADTFIFFFDKEQAKDTLENYNGEKLTIANYKSYLLGEIQEAGEGRQYKEKQEMEKRTEERKTQAEYKKERATQAEAERKAKLLSMTNKR